MASVACSDGGLSSGGACGTVLGDGAVARTASEVNGAFVGIGTVSIVETGATYALVSWTPGV